MGVGAGGAMAVQDMIRQMRRLQRETEERRRQMRARRRKAGHAPRPVEAVREDFECYYLCAQCGYLAQVSGACPSCGQSGLLDLSQHAVADQLRDFEARRRAEVPTWVRWVTRGAALAAGVLTATLLAALGGWGAFPLLLGGVVALLVLFLGPRPLSVQLLKIAKSRVHRWRHPEPPARAERGSPRTCAGPAASRNDTLQAPFSGRACIAYRIAVLFDIDGDARPPEWVLDETWARELTIDGVEIDSAKVFIANGLQQLEAEDMALGREPLETFLRQRGLHLSDGSFWYFEALVEENEAVRCTLHDGGTCELQLARD